MSVTGAGTPLLPPKATSGDTSTQEKKNDFVQKTIKYEEVGIWTTIREVNVSWGFPGISIVGRASDLPAMFPFVYRFFCECFRVGPWLIVIYLVASLWESTQSAVDLYFSSQILDIIQNGILHQEVDRDALVVAVIYRIAFTFVHSVLRRARRRTKTILANRVRYLFEERLLQANLSLDLPTFEEPDTAPKINRLIPTYDSGGAWKILENLLQKFQVITSVASQAGFLFNVLQSQPGSAWFTFLCLAKSMLDYSIYGSLSAPTYTWASNPHYRRLSSLKDMGIEASHRIEIVSNVLADYIQREWKKAKEFMRDVSDDHPWSIKSQKPLISTFFDLMANDFPLILYAYQVALSPGTFSLTSVALLQQASSSLAWTISSITSSQHTILEEFNKIKTIYEISHIQNNLRDGDLHYPQSEKETSPGMGITFQNVSFAYSNAENVLKDVSFTIRSGQTVIIVGVNGSGKSTLLKLFNRLYDPSSGTVLVDGVPMQSFRAADVRRASAILFQKYSHFSLPIRENISIGLPDIEPPSKEAEKAESESGGPVVEAARLGGAEEFVNAQQDGFDTILQPTFTAWSMNTTQNMSPLFDKEMKKIKKTADVSQGQWQRLALSRLFFRAAGENTKLVAVDEPSASLDPEMEYELFKRLKELSSKKGKTMVFVTHRFGHLTKDADLILVMQKGCLVEQGNHKDLMEIGGEYAKLYNKQAEAFISDDGQK